MNICEPICADNSDFVLTPEILREQFSYDPLTGILRWRRNNPNDHRMIDRIGVEAGGVRSAKGLSYRWVRYKNWRLATHVIAWAIMTGDMPKHKIDHRDGNGLNNIWKNLRAASQQQNSFNRKINSNNSSGFKGVSFHKRERRYYAVIKINQKARHLGSFVSAKDAHEAYKKAALELFGDFAHDGMQSMAGVG